MDMKELQKIFFPKTVERQEKLKNEKTHFVHYTGIDAFMDILRSKEIWLRSVDCMNDYMEVDYGLKRLRDAYDKSEQGSGLRKALDSVYDGFSRRFDDLFWGWAPTLREQTYIFCMSEHNNEEDPYGRLSMWRAYGKDTRLAVVLKNDPFLRYSDTPGIYTAPVEYLDEEKYKKWFTAVADNISYNINFLQEVEEDTLKECIFYCFLSSATCTKHPGFSEEREWRIVHTTKLFGTSDVPRKEIENIGGIPQTIYKIPLKNRPEHGLTGIEIPELLDRVIIGPTQHPTLTRKAIVELLEEAGVPDSNEKVFLSDIPLR